MREAGPIFNQNPDGGAYILTSSIAVSYLDLIDWTSTEVAGNWNKRQQYGLFRLQSCWSTAHEMSGGNTRCQDSRQCSLAGAASD